MAHGFRRFELMATLPGVRLYAARGYVPGAPVRVAAGRGLSIDVRADEQDRALRIDRASENFREHTIELFTGPAGGQHAALRRLGYVRVREKMLSPAVTLVFMEKLR